MLLLVVSIGYLVIPSREDGEESGRGLVSSRPDPAPSSRLRMTRSLSTWHAPTDFLLRTPGHELLTTTPQLKPRIPGGRA
jgi:hypothetical protein